MFIDRVNIKTKAGDGGNGLISFRRERYVERGGPDGGDGGDGGDVIVRTSHNVNTLARYRHEQTIKADNGQKGGPQKRHGKSASDIEIVVPVGTAIYEAGELIADLITNKTQFVVAKGGKGGYGNAHFKSSVRQAPKHAENGEPGEEKELQLELKLIADAGLVGLPNAGKSSLLSVISNAKPAIANYPFTTTIPNLGVVDIDDNSFLVADIPGLIEGASNGKGLGDEFLRHVERTKVLVHLIDGTSADVTRDYLTIKQELAEYAVDLSVYPQIIVISKTDLLSPEDLKQKKAMLKKVTKQRIHTVSAQAHKGIPVLLREVLRQIEKQQAEAAQDEAVDDIPVYSLPEDPSLWSVEQTGNRQFSVTGKDIERFAIRTDEANPHAVDRMLDILHKRGILKTLEKNGYKAGDTVVIANKHFNF